MTAGEKLLDAYSHFSGIAGMLATALEKRRVPSRSALHEAAAKLNRASVILEALSKEKST